MALYDIKSKTVYTYDIVQPLSEELQEHYYVIIVF